MAADVIVASRRFPCANPACAKWLAVAEVLVRRSASGAERCVADAREQRTCTVSRYGGTRPPVFPRSRRSRTSARCADELTVPDSRGGTGCTAFSNRLAPPAGRAHRRDRWAQGLPHPPPVCTRRRGPTLATGIRGDRVYGERPAAAADGQGRGDGPIRRRGSSAPAAARAARPSVPAVRVA